MSKVVIGWDPGTVDETFVKFVKTLFKKHPEVVVGTFINVIEVLAYMDNKECNALQQLLSSITVENADAALFNKFIKKAMAADSVIMTEFKNSVMEKINKDVLVDMEVPALINAIKAFNKELLSSDTGKVAKKFFGKPKLILLN